MVAVDLRTEIALLLNVRTKIANRGFWGRSWLPRVAWVDGADDPDLNSFCREHLPCAGYSWLIAADRDCLQDA